MVKRLYLGIILIFMCLILTRCGRDSSPGKPGVKLVRIPVGKIAIDGRAGDWSEVPYLVNGVSSGISDSIEIESVKATYDNQNLYLLLESKHVASAAASICVDCDRSRSTGVNLHIEGTPAQFKDGWDYVIKLTYSYSSGGGPMLISQVEKFKKVSYGYSSELVLEHKNNIEDPEYVGASESFQELKIPLRVLGIELPTEAAFLFEEGTGGIFSEYEQCCQAVAVKLE